VSIKLSFSRESRNPVLSSNPGLRSRDDCSRRSISALSAVRAHVHIRMRGFPGSPWRQIRQRAHYTRSEDEYEEDVDEFDGFADEAAGFGLTNDGAPANLCDLSNNVSCAATGPTNRPTKASP
jgi:hypothetical protein